MDYRSLLAWAQAHAEPRDLVFDDLLRGENEFLIRWKRNETALLVYLGSDDAFACFTQRVFAPVTHALEGVKRILEKALLTGISCAPGDRIVTLEFRKATPYNRDEHHQLVLELIPRFGNLILVRDGKVVDALRIFTPAENPARPILPDQPYRPPDPPKSPLKDSGEPIPADLDRFFEDRFFGKIIPQRVDRLRTAIVGRLRKDLNRKLEKLAKQEAELRNAEEEERWRRYAELLRGNFQKLEPSLSVLRVTDWFDPDQKEIDIPLIAGLSPTRNIAEYARKARKAKSGRQTIRRQIARTHDEIAAFEARIRETEAADSYAELRELQSGSRVERTDHKTRAPFRRIPIDADWEILIGRTAAENDLLTTRTARPEDWWFHSRVFRGTHVVLRNLHRQDPPERLVRICASLAAYYSQAKHSSRVPVDYTQIRHVRKPRGSVPGYVIYTHQKTYYADPVDIRAAARELGVSTREEA
jgi:predicted ribosome quality control (RQC) complex YloA/Tae2 family protein